MCIGILPACMSLCKGIRSPGTGVTDTCVLLCGYWELNPGPLEDQPVLLTAEPSLQPLFTHFHTFLNPLSLISAACCLDYWPILLTWWCVQVTPAACVREHKGHIMSWRQYVRPSFSSSGAYVLFAASSMVILHFYFILIYLSLVLRHGLNYTALDSLELAM